MILGLLLSWSVGLVPALVYRYMIFKKPIDKKKVFLRLAPVITVFMIVYKQIPGLSRSLNPIPWVIIYFIGKWIMTRNYISDQNVGGIIKWDEDCSIQTGDSLTDTSNNSDEILPPEITCPNCKVILELEDEERKTKKVICPECNFNIFQ